MTLAACWIGLVLWVVGMLVIVFVSRWTTWHTDDPTFIPGMIVWPAMPFILAATRLYRAAASLLPKFDRWLAFHVLARLVEDHPKGQLYVTVLPRLAGANVWSADARPRHRNFLLVRDPETTKPYRIPLPPVGIRLSHTRGIVPGEPWTVERALAWTAGLPPSEPYSPEWEA